MSSAKRAVATYLGASIVLWAVAAPAAARPAPITGKLSRPGYTVIALASNGRGVSVSATTGKFSIVPPANRLTLQLRSQAGIYAGPVVVGGTPTRAITGVRAGARLGLIKVRNGYARTSKPLARKWFDKARQARARKGMPIGAGNFGRVLSALPRTPVPGDRDFDGVPDAVDIDDDGDLILDDLDHSSAAHAAQATQQFHIGSELVLPIQFSVNVNAGSSDADIEAGLANTAGTHSGGRLSIESLPGDSPPELDCGGTPNPKPPPARIGGLIYCSTGGTGRVFQPGVEFSSWPRFPDAFDPDGDGYGTLNPGLTLSHGARSDQIRTGDLLIERVVRSGVESAFTATVQYIFVTGPALVSYGDTAGHSGTVSYPATTDPFTVGPGSDGDVVLTLTFWRPQRKRIAADPAPGPGDSSEWTDIGGLNYEVAIAHVEDMPGAGGVVCPQDAFSTTDPNLTPEAITPPGGGFRDVATDRPANRADTLTYTLNATRCLAANGLAWNPDKTVGLDFFAKTDAGDRALQGGVSFKRSAG